MRTIVCGRGAESLTGSVRSTLVDGLIEAGHDVRGFDPLAHGGDAATRTDALLGALADVERCVVVPTPGDLDLARLRAGSIVHGVLTMAVHSAAALPGAPTRLADVGEHVEHFDVVALPHRDAMAAWQPVGRHGLVELPAAVTSLVADAGVDASGPAPGHLVVALGDHDHHNADLVRSLVDADLDVVVVGKGWDGCVDLAEHLAGDLHAPARAALVRRARLAVELPPTLWARSDADAALEECVLTQPGLEAAAVGTALVAFDRPGLDRQLEPGVEVLVARGPADLATLVGLVLCTPDLVDSIGAAAATRLETARWARRWADLEAHFDLHAPVAGPLVLDPSAPGSSNRPAAPGSSPEDITDITDGASGRSAREVSGSS